MWTHERRTALERIGLGLPLSRALNAQVPWLLEQGFVEPSSSPGRWSLTKGGSDALLHEPLPERRLSQVEVEALRQYATPDRHGLPVRRDVEERLREMRLIQHLRDAHGWATRSYEIAPAGVAELARHAGIGTRPSTQSQMCACGHSRGEHSRERGICSVCYGASEHGAKPYCSRFRKAQ